MRNAGILTLFLLEIPKILANGKVKVFVLAGQSNMVGKASIDHLDLLVQNDNEYRTALYEDGGYKTSENVYIKYSLFDSHGRLTVSRDSGYASPGAFGPELMFGFTLGSVLQKETILLIKTAWGGKTLAVDFRSPSSGEGHYDKANPIDYGKFYRNMIVDVLDTLDSIGEYVPGAVDYELAGFVWFQGWNDMLNYPMVYEYGGNLVNFIHDVRLDLDMPELPFVIGELGMHGTNVTGREAPRVLGMRKAQKDVALLPEFQTTSRFVPTASYVVSNGTTYNGIYHYYGRADTYFHIGKALGVGMQQLMQKSPSKESMVMQQ